MYTSNFLASEIKISSSQNLSFNVLNFFDKNCGMYIVFIVKNVNYIWKKILKKKNIKAFIILTYICI